jgi:cytosine/adenosine deaminase-related metal-dependent hydrolase
MHTNSPEDPIRDGVLFVRDGVIEAIYGSEEVIVIPQSAAVIDAQGGFVLPGESLPDLCGKCCLIPTFRIY